MIKEQLLTKILGILDQKMQAARAAIDSAKESRDNETKSSVGDKYETSRTLMQMEVEKNRALLMKTELLKNELLKIDINKPYSKVEFGSLIITDEANFFISGAFGKLEIDGSDYFCISLASPIGKQLRNKTVGESFVFQSKTTKILRIE